MASDETSQAPLVGIPEIADIAGVGRSAVSNWRKRHADFPQARLQAASGALFDLEAVERWLIENGKLANRVSADKLLWALADTARGEWSVEDFASFCVTCLVYFEVCARADDPTRGRLGPDKPVVAAHYTWSRASDGPAEEFLDWLRSAAYAIEEANPDVSGLLLPGIPKSSPGRSGLAWRIACALESTTDDDITPRYALFEEAMSNLVRADRFAEQFATPDDVSELVTRLLEGQSGTLIDLALGEGGLLLMAAVRPRADSSDQTRVFGIEVDERVWRLARARFYLYDVPATIRLGDALRGEPRTLPKADAVYLDPPYGTSGWGDADVYLDPQWTFGPPPPSCADMAWVQLAIRQLNPAGRAGVLLPRGSLSRSGREADIRQAMVAADAVEAVIVLPRRLRTDTSLQLALWLLRHPGQERANESILLVDASELGEVGRRRFWLPEEAIERIVDIVRLWETEGRVEESNLAVGVPRSTIAEGDLDPRRYWRAEPAVDVETLLGQRARGRLALAAALASSAEAAESLLTFLVERP
ncbi:MAG: N-6 DNA methylase [Acidimicrobiales bacterium]